ncbi:MAG TPA: hypothetical protein VGD87_11055, partial [Archangium sp.]
MKLPLFVALFTLCSTAALAQDVDITVPGMRVKMRTETRGPRPAPPPPAPVIVAPEPAYVVMVDFAALVDAVNAENFGDAKLDVVRTADGGFTVDQLG